MTVMALAIALIACASPPSLENESVPEVVVPEQTTDTLVSYTVGLSNGEAVECIGSKYSGGSVIPDCNWDNIFTAEPASLNPGSLLSYTVTTKDGYTVVCVGSKYSGGVVAPDCNWPSAATR